MSKPDFGQVCLSTAVAFAVVAGGHITLDARPAEASPAWVLLAFVAAAALALGLNWAHRAQTALLALAAMYALGDVWLGLLPPGDNFPTVRMLVAVPILGGCLSVLATRRIVQLPTMLYAGFVVLLVAAMGTSVLVSEFKSVSADAFLNWILFAAAMYLGIATLGRIKGPEALLTTVVAAGGFVALKGIVQYLAARATEPTFRIFAGWNNPNALAGMLAVVIPLALALAVVGDKPKRTLAVVAGALAITAVALTQSKGGFIVVGIGFVAFLAPAIIWKAGRSAARLVAPIAAGIALTAIVFVTTPKTAQGAAPGQRIVGATAESTQSTAFRKLLWRGAVELVKRQPVGYGAGTYRFYSAMPGLTEQTQLAHQSYLQVAAEGGVVAIVSVLGLAVVWTVRMFRGARALATERNVLRAGVFAAVVACAADAALESNFFYLGTGLLLFVLVGAGLQLAADGTTPESLPAGLRGLLATTCCAAPLAAMVWSYWLANAKADLLATLPAHDPEATRAKAAPLESLGPFDGESWYLRGLYQAGSQEERITDLKLATDYAPSTRNWRALAQAQRQAGNAFEAIKALDKALAYDNYNLRTLALKMQIERETGATSEAVKTAQAIVAVEQTPYLQVRALPEYVPTEPFDARIFLATQTEDAAERTRLLQEAIDGFVRYRQTTVPMVVKLGEGGYDYNGDTRQDAAEKMERAREACEELRELYGKSGDSTSLGRLSAVLTTLTLD